MCARCRLPYPTALLSPLIVGAHHGITTQTLVCGICALAVMNDLHGLTRTRFPSSGAETLRRKALRWRRQHPHLIPEDTHVPRT